MKHALPLVVLLATVLPLRADFRTGKEAYERGDYETAIREWRPLAEQGLAEAQFNLGLVYYHGKGVEQDRAKALGWYLKSADSGYPRAQYKVAEMFETGDGTERDLLQAMVWFKLAGTEKYEDARKRRKRVAKHLTPYEIAQAEMLVRHWLREQEKKQE